MGRVQEVVGFLVIIKINISSLQTHNVNRCGRSRHLARKLSLRSKRSSPNVFEMAATETITSIILIKLIKVSLGTVRHRRRFKIVVIDFFFSSRRRHTRFDCDWSSDVCSSDLPDALIVAADTGDPTIFYYARRKGWHFLEKHGIYAGNPSDNQEAITNLEELRRREIGRASCRERV